MEEGAQTNEGILYSNKASRGEQDFSMDTEIFAVLDKDLFNGPTVDTNATI